MARTPAGRGSWTGEAVGAAYTRTVWLYFTPVAAAVLALGGAEVSCVERGLHGMQKIALVEEVFRGFNVGRRLQGMRRWGVLELVFRGCR